MGRRGPECDDGYAGRSDSVLCLLVVANLAATNYSLGLLDRLVEFLREGGELPIVLGVLGEIALAHNILLLYDGLGVRSRCLELDKDGGHVVAAEA